MRKIVFMLAFLFIGMQVLAQSTITGTVTDDKGELVPGVNVWVKGFSDIGSITDMDGKYSINVPAEATALGFSFMGMKTQEVEIGGQTTINVTLESEDYSIGDVVVTALGVSREERSLGYATQEISADEIAVKDAISVANSLQGRVAGVQIKSGSGTVGGSSSVLIRGVSSLGGTNQPLYIVDGTPISNYDFSGNTSGYDYGNGAQDINPDDVESISILKGAAATTLYGNRGANGVIVITTKSGKKKKGIGVELNSTTTFENVYILPSFQNEYGGGRSLDFSTFTYDPSIHGPEWASFDGTPYVYTGTDESWGPKLDGQQVLHWDSFVPESGSYNQTRPWVANPDNYKNLFDTGITLSNSVAINGGDKNSSFRIGFTNINQSGVIPTSHLKKNIVSFKGSTKVHDRIEVFASVNYIKQETTGRSRFGYSGSGLTVPGAMRIWTQRQVDSDRMRNLYYSDVLGEQVGWNLRDISDGRLYIRWSNNPYWTFNNIYAEDAKDRMYGNVGFKIELIEGLELTTIGRTDFYTLNINDRVGSGGTATDYYGESTKNAFENNFESILSYNKRFNEDWSLNAILGGNIRYSQYKSSAINTVDGLVIENFFNISNTVSPANSSSYFAERQTNSLFGSASIGYKDMLYLDISGRNDWSSTLPVENNSYFYPAVSGSFVFSELMGNKSILSFGKLRAGYAQVGNDTYAYRLYNTYDVTSFGTTTTFSVNNSRKNPSLKNETTAEIEFGVEAALYNGRIGADFTYFSRKAFDQIIALDISSTSGYSSAFINAGELQNTGYEAIIYGIPVKTNNFSWDISMNFSRYTSKVNSLYGDLEDYNISSVGSAWVNAVVGGEYGTMYASGGFVYDDEGRKIVDASGYYERSGTPQKVGSIIPDFNGGIMNTFNYKGITFSALIDFQSGGLVYSYANRFAASAGQMPQTAGLNDKGNPMRDDVADGGGIRAEGVFVDGTENNIYVDPRSYFRDLRNFQEEYMYDASFVKLRELKLGYTLPQSLVSKIKLQAATVSIVARNVALLHSNADGFDPEQVNTISNVQGYEGGSLPSSRSIGFNINLKF